MKLLKLQLTILGTVGLLIALAVGFIALALGF